MDQDATKSSVPSEELLNAIMSAISKLSFERPKPFDRCQAPAGSVVISGIGLGLPGADKQVMDPDNVFRVLQGEQLIDLIPERFRRAILKKRITRLVKSSDGGGRFDTLDSQDKVIKLAARPGTFDLAQEYGVDPDLVEALDITSQLAMAAGLDALAEAGIPLQQRYKKTTTGKYLPDRFGLSDGLRDETGIIFASIFPGLSRFHEELRRYYSFRNLHKQLSMLLELRSGITDPTSLQKIDAQIHVIREKQNKDNYQFDRRFLFRVLAMGHSQFAEYIGARGPNAQVNSACASTTQAVGMAEDWILSGRCRRVIVIAADSVTDDELMAWIGSGFQAVGAAATDDQTNLAALPFDRRRHGLVLGMGSCAFVVESQDAVAERGMRGIVEILGSEQRNSAFHGTRLDPDHISSVLDQLLATVEKKYGLNRKVIAPQTVYVSHETYTPARGGSASAEVQALRNAFGEAANQVVITNTKGYTGHPMGVGIEDAIAVKILEHGLVPPVVNHEEQDPELGPLNLSRGGRYPVQYALHMAAGFGSQLSITFFRRIPGVNDRVEQVLKYHSWLDQISGTDNAQTEIVNRTLRIRSTGVPLRRPGVSNWLPGTGPGERAAGPAHYPEPAPGVSTPSREKAPIANAATKTDDLRQKILDTVASMTNHPSDMLDLDQDLEADLGIDMFRKVEWLIKVCDGCGVSPEEVKLKEVNTLGQLVQALSQHQAAASSGRASG